MTFLHSGPPSSPLHLKGSPSPRSPVLGASSLEPLLLQPSGFPNSPSVPGSPRPRLCPGFLCPGFRPRFQAPTSAGSSFSQARGPATLSAGLGVLRPRMLPRPPNPNRSLGTHVFPLLPHPHLLRSPGPFSPPRSPQPQTGLSGRDFLWVRKSPGESPAGKGEGAESLRAAPRPPPHPLPSWELQSSLRSAPLLCASHPESRPRSRQTGTRAPAAAGSSLRRSLLVQAAGSILSPLKKLPASHSRPGPGSASFPLPVSLLLLTCTSFSPPHRPSSLGSPLILAPESSKAHSGKNDREQSGRDSAEAGKGGRQRDRERHSQSGTWGPDSQTHTQLGRIATGPNIHRVT